MISFNEEFFKLLERKGGIREMVNLCLAAICPNGDRLLCIEDDCVPSILRVNGDSATFYRFRHPRITGSLLAYPTVITPADDRPPLKCRQWTCHDRCCRGWENNCSHIAILNYALRFLKNPERFPEQIR